jgi:AraC-like DNA-binding protein
MQPIGDQTRGRPGQPSGGLRLQLTRYEAHRVQPRHRHEGGSLSLVVGGELEETTATMRHRARAGDIVVKPAECWHADVYGPRGACVVQIQCDWPDSSVPAGSTYGWLESLPLARAVLGILHGRNGAGEQCELAFWDVVERACLGRMRESEPGPGWWRDAVDLLDECSQRFVSVGEVASRVGVHPVHLARVVRARRGSSVRRYIHERRVLAAWRACQSGAVPLAAIAARFCFADQAHMTRVFARVLGISPGQLKRLACPAGPE